MVFGRKQEASDDDASRWSTSTPPLPPQDGQFRQPTDVTWDPARQHLHQRRLHQFAGRQATTRTATGSSRGASRATDRASSTPPTASPPTPRATSTSPTAVTAASRSSTVTASSCARSRSTCRCPPTPRRAIGNKPDRRRSHQRRHACARRAVGAVHHAAAEPGALQLGRVPGPRSTSCRSTARFWACSARPASSSKQFGWIHEIACPSRERAVRRRDSELARAEADPASRVGEERRPVTGRSLSYRPAVNAGWRRGTARRRADRSSPAPRRAGDRSAALQARRAPRHCRRGPGRRDCIAA